MVHALLKCLSLYSSPFILKFRLVKFLWSSFLKTLILFSLALSFNLTIVVAAEASTCRQLSNHRVCILSLKRSAKYYWEYRAAISIDGQKKPIEIYNCRERIKINYHKTVVPFAQDGTGEFVCSLYKR